MQEQSGKARILMVLDEPFPPDTRVENEAVSLVEAGFEVLLLAIGPDSRPPEEFYRGIRIIRRRLPRELRNKMRGLAGTVPVLTYFLDREIRKVYRRYPFDVLHLHDLWIFGGGLRAAARLGLPVVGDLHENYPEVLRHYAWSTRFPGRFFVSIPRWRRLEERWVNALDRVIFVVQEMRDRCGEIRLPESHQVIVPNTINVKEVDECRTDAQIVSSLREETTFVYTGTINLHRGLDIVIRAMPRVLARVPCKLVVVGEGRIRGELEALSVECGVSDRIEFHGWKPRPLLKSYILGSRACLAPHVKGAHNDASAPHKLFHYMYLKRPVLVTNCVSMERVVNEAQCGVVVPYGDVEAMAEALSRLAQDPDLAARLGENGHCAAVDRYNWDATVRPMVRMYRDLVR